ncbi:XPG3 [Auxenochlorella protothecoides x Auxenochlorella symbiontica]
MKVALERSIQWLRHGCLPVIVVEGRAPAEKLAAVQARYAARNGVDGGGRGSSSFIALGKSVGVMLQQLGLPVFYSPGEAEATCAALVRAGRVDAAASFDSDTLVHGAERVYHTLKLSTLKPGECELVSCDLGDIRKALGIQRGGQAALSVIAMLAGSDYDLVGTSGVGSVGSLKLLRHLLGPGAQDDSGVLEALEALVARPPDAELAALTKCTGCKRCGHEGGRKGAVARHTPKNPCPCCAELDAAGAGRGPAGEEGDGAGAARAEGCRARAFARCDCAFHRREAERGVEAIARRIRADAAPLAAARAAAAVFQREAGAADAYVAARAAELGGAPGARLHWLHRPRTLAVWAELERRRVKLTWDLPMLRGKLLPLLLDWDLAHSGEENGAGEGGGGGTRPEFWAREVQKVQGGAAAGPRKAAGAAAAPPRGWRYVVRWERVPGVAAEAYPPLLAVRPRERRGRGAGGEEGPEPASQSRGSQGAASQAEGADAASIPMTLEAFDRHWLDGSTAEARSVRISAVRQHAAQLEQRHLSGSRSGGRGGARPAPASPETQGLLARLLVQQRARALLGPKLSAGPAVARGPDSAVLAAARGSSVVGDARGGAATARAPARRGRGLAEGWAGARPEEGGGEAQVSPTPRAAVGTASPRKRGLREAGGGVGPASPAGAALLQGAGTQRSPAKSADIRRYVEQGSPGRLGPTACEGGELDLTTPEGCCRSPAIDLTQT